MHKEKFMIYRRDAKKGEATYSPKSHSAPHFVGHYVEGMEEWASWYCFNKKEDGSYEAELDEAWNEGSHYGGGTIDVDIPKEWFALSYDDFLERVITLAAATHYGFTVDDLKERKGLKQFFGFKDSIKLIRLSEEHTIAFKEEMQESFQHGFEAYNKDAEETNQWQVLPDKDFYQSLEAKGAEAYEAFSEDGQRVGGAIITANGNKGEPMEQRAQSQACLSSAESQQRKTVGQLAFLYVKVGVQSKGIGQSIWKAIETMHPEIEVWETCTPYFDRRNIHFYINRCGFHAVEFFNEHHPDPNMPRQPNEQREQSDVNISSAESRERKSEAQFDQEDGLFKFEKRMK